MAAVCDVATPASEALAAKKGARVAASVEEMARAKDLDAVSVCVPPALHFDCCRPFLRVRRPILCEEPLEVNLAFCFESRKPLCGKGFLLYPAGNPPILSHGDMRDRGVDTADRCAVM